MFYQVYSTVYKIFSKDDTNDKPLYSGEIYILPMVRYIFHFQRMLQIRWLIFGINICFKKHAKV